MEVGLKTKQSEKKNKKTTGRRRKARAFWSLLSRKEEREPKSERFRCTHVRACTGANATRPRSLSPSPYSASPRESKGTRALLLPVRKKKQREKLAGVSWKPGSPGGPERDGPAEMCSPAERALGSFIFSRKRQSGIGGSPGRGKQNSPVALPTHDTMKKGEKPPLLFPSLTSPRKGHRPPRKDDVLRKKNKIRN